MTQSGINTLFFDLDGTLTDPKDGIVRSYLFALRGMGHENLPSEAELLPYIGPPLHDGLAEWLQTEDRPTIEQAVDTYRDRYREVGKFENRVYDGVPEMLADLKEQGFRLFVATSKAQPLAEEILGHYGLIHFFDGVFGSELDGTRGDKTELLAYAVAQTGSQPGKSAMVGDRKYDMVAATNMGLWACGAGWGYGSVDELTSAGAQAICSAPDDVVSLFIDAPEA